MTTSKSCSAKTGPRPVQKTKFSLINAPARPLTQRERDVWEALKTITERAIAPVANTLEGQAELSSPDFAILSQLEHRGGTLAQQDLQKKLGWDKSRLSHQLTRMQRRGLLRRTSVDDRIIIKIRIAGGIALAAAHFVHAAAVRQHLLRHLDKATEDTVLKLAGQLWRSSN